MVCWRRGCSWLRLNHNGSFVGWTTWRWLHPALRRRQHISLRWRSCTAHIRIGVRRQLLLWQLLRRSGPSVVPGSGRRRRQPVLAGRSLRRLSRPQWLGGIQLRGVAPWPASWGHRGSREARPTLGDQHRAIVFALLFGHVTSAHPHHHSDVQSQLNDPDQKRQKRRHLNNDNNYYLT